MKLTADAPFASCDIAIVGGGLGGASLAYFLACEGAEVCIIERGDLFGAASGANAGTLHEQTIMSGSGDWQTCERQASVIPIMQEGARLWLELEKDWGADLRLNRNGGLMIAESDFEVETLRRKVEIERAAGGGARLLERDELREIAPYVTPLAKCAVFTPNEGKVNILAAVTALANKIRNLPVRQHTHTSVEDFKLSANGVRILTNRGIVKAERLVLAAGAWNQALAAKLGWSLPLHIRPIQCAATEAAPHFILHTIQHATRRLSLKQNHHGTVVVGGGWPALSQEDNAPPSVLPSSVNGAMATAQHVVPKTGGLRVLRAWASYSSTPIDEIPVIGPIPDAHRCFILQTNRLGITSAHALARSLADIILFEKRDFVAELARPERSTLRAPPSATTRCH